ncbi:hypothetical protein [Haladaptatus sp. AB643]|uniref:hypothetical protein n=1 Tax=Haladaptatus sp. AB643 TaxID=2934174 RepID=UPI00209C047C|nr:hypothetical protein [Haladaptatus sp. AB643]MCO8242962.1 hypothetical protein [Haladaptatus sp. AB643]
MTSQEIPIDDGEECVIENSIEGESDDLYLVNAGFEERALAATNLLSPSYEADWGIIYVNSEYLMRESAVQTKKHLSELQKELESHCKNVDVVMGSWLEADEQLFSIRDSFEELTDRDSLDITIDVTSFNRESLLVSLNILYSLVNDVNTRILYVSPAKYGDWLSKGHRFVRNIIGFGGIQSSNKPTLLILLTGFETDRAKNVIEEIEPAETLVGFGDNPTERSFLEKNKQEQEKLLARQDTVSFQFSADSIEKSQSQIEKLLKKHNQAYNVVICPMSTKLSTLGVWKAARKYPEAQVVYSLPIEYNIKDYSSGSKTLYVDWI